jgi:hypothetical protein
MTRKAALFPEVRSGITIGIKPTHNQTLKKGDFVKLLGYHSGLTGVLSKLLAGDPQNGRWRVLVDNTNDVVTIGAMNLRKNDASSDKLERRLCLNRTPAELEAQPHIRAFRRRNKGKKSRTGIKDKWTLRALKEADEAQENEASKTRAIEAASTALVTT